MKRLITLVTIANFLALSLFASAVSEKKDMRGSGIPLIQFSDQVIMKDASTGINLDDGPYIRNFEDENDIAGWVSVDANADETTWQQYNKYGLDDSYCLNYNWHSANNADDWAFSPGFVLNENETYHISFYYKTGGYEEKMKLYYSTDQTSENSILIKDFGAIYNRDSIKFSQEISVTTGGSYHFGWYCYSDADKFHLSIDSLVIEKIGSSSGGGSTPTIDAIFEATTATSGTAPLDVTFSSTSTGSITNYTWYFGDGTNESSFMGVTNHTYTATGTYDVKLVVSNETERDSMIITDYVTVMPAGTNGTETENNDTYGAADAISLNGSMTGQLSSSDTEDWYIVTTPYDGALTFTSSPDLTLASSLFLYGSDGTTYIGGCNVCGNTGEVDTLVKSDLAAGTYYLQINNDAGQGSYMLSASFEATTIAEGNDSEPNGSYSNAIEMNLGESKTGHLGYHKLNIKDTEDWYVVTTPYDGALTFATNPDLTLASSLYIYGSDGTTYIGACSVCGNTGEVDTLVRYDLAAGTYYLQINNDAGQGSYMLSASFEATTIAEGNDSEPNGSYSNAVEMNLGESKTGHLGYHKLSIKDTEDWYVVTTPYDGALTFTTNPDLTLASSLYLYDSDGTTYIGACSVCGNTGEVDTLVRYDLLAGTYYLQINNDAGQGSYTLKAFDKNGLTICAAFSSDITSGKAPLAVQFTDRSDGATSWEWDFDNDGTVDSELQSPSYTYTTAGTYSVKLTVSDGTNSAFKLKSDYIVVVTAGSSTLSAAFSADKTTGEAPLIVQFTDASINATSWKWDFDNDGNVDSELQSPFYTYTTAGTYSAKLTVSDGTNSDFTLKSNYIIVTDTSNEASGGDGSVSSPWQIKTPQQLDSIHNYLGTIHKDKYFILMNDIDMTDYLSEGHQGYNDGDFWEPIGDVWGGKFTGNFDGNNHIVKNLKINGSSYLGLFGYTEEGSTIKNLGVEINVDSEISGSSDYLGGIAGYCKGTIENCFVTGNISSTGSDFDNGNVGGIAGALVDSGLIINCYSTNGIITGTSDIGGLVGQLRRGRIQNSYSEMTVSGNSSIGGLVGESWWGSVDSCHSTGAVTGAAGEAGGLVGYNEYGIITTSYASGNVSGGEDIGGLVGKNYGFNLEEAYAYIIKSFASGNVSGTDNIGGLVGTNQSSTIQNSYASGMVTGTNKIGGLNGYNDADGVITNSYSYGLVTGTTDVGGLVGSQYQSTWHPGTTTNSFWDLETSGQSVSSAGTGKTSAEMKNLTTYSDAEWDFTKIWKMSANANNGYPDYKWHDSNASSNISAIAYSSIIKLSPNPATTQLTVESDGAKMSSIAIYDINAAMVSNNDALSTSKFILNTEHLSSGIYIVKVISNNSISVEKLIIK